VIQKTIYYLPILESIPEQSQEISQILEKYNINGPDKPGGTDKDSCHSYTGAYELLLSPHMGKNINLLEVGIQYGGSALLWHDYLPESKLALVDPANLVHENIFNKMLSHRYIFYNQDAYSEETVGKIRNDFREGFDVAIDDGPHTIESQVLFLEKYIPLMKRGGVMVIEDIQDVGYVNILLESVPAFLRPNVRIIDLRSVKGRWDDLMFVLHI
jgi:hypothetical protein